MTAVCMANTTAARRAAFATLSLLLLCARAQAGEVLEPAPVPSRGGDYQAGDRKGNHLFDAAGTRQEQPLRPPARTPLERFAKAWHELQWPVATMVATAAQSSSGGSTRSWKRLLD